MCSTLGRFPPIADGYERVPRDGLLYLFDKDVTEKDPQRHRRTLHRTPASTA